MVVVATATALLLLIGACDRGAVSGPVGDKPPPDSGSGRTAAPTTTAGTTPPTEAPGTSPPPPPSDDEQILAAYQGYWDTWLAANNPPNPDHPDLAKYATGEALERVVARIRANLAEGVSIRPPAVSQRVHEAEILQRDGDTATVTDCAIDDLVKFRQADGDVLDDRTMTVLGHASLRRDDGQWRVAEVVQVKQWVGVKTCDHSSRFH